MRILIIRFSALGDVALLVPIIREIHRSNPNAEIFILTDPRYSALFKNMPYTHTLNLNAKSDFSGIVGLFRLFRILKSYSFDKIFDLHQSIRSVIIGSFFRLTGSPVFRINKGRSEKKNLLGKVNLNNQPLKHTTNRYCEVFLNAGLKMNLLSKKVSESGIVISEISKSKIKNTFNKSEHQNFIGIAPFSRNKLKEWPFTNIIELIKTLIPNEKNKIFLFGHGKIELEKLRIVQALSNNKIFLSSDYCSFEEELALMTELDIMITMDSANMHLAELCGCPQVISIWGPTHHAIGFTPFFSGTKNIVEIPVKELSCRPCSVFGNKPCHRGDHACMNRITPDKVLSKIY